MASHVLATDILDKISRCLSDSPEKLARLLYFLVKEENVERYERVLRSVIDNVVAFKNIVEKLVNDVDHLETDPEYRRLMADIWNNYLKPNEKADVGNGHQRFDLQLYLRRDQTQAIFTINFIETLSRLPPSSQAQIVSAITNVAETVLPSGMALALRQSASNALSLTRGASGKLVGVTLAAVYLSYEIYKDICRWWKGEISGVRCVKNVIDGTASMAAGVGGGFAGAAIGTALIPGVGTVIGGIVGGITAASVMSALSDWVTQKIFNLPKEEALENAYRFLGLSYGASNDQINAAFKRLVLKYHPDKGGSYEDWHKLQVSMAVIKASKGEF